MNRINKIILVLGCILLISGCISTAQQFELRGTRWILQLMHGKALLENTAITLKISEDGISGSSGCNFYGAKYTTQPKNGIKIGEVAHTEMACNEPVGIMEQEEEYINTFQNETSYDLDGENLFIVNKQGKILLQYQLLPEFNANPESLVGKTWRLNYADGMEEYELDAFTLNFDGSKFRGTTSCRDYEGIYQSVEDNIHIYMLKMTTDVECVQKQRNAEGTYTNLLGGIDQFNVSQNRLEFYTVKNEKLIFDLASDY